ncbi:MAG: VCBS repeat-containing protein [Myxococcota bacterium]|nr:VCBS repeat-containing protein [Myxococcota bacterium]
MLLSTFWLMTGCLDYGVEDVKSEPGPGSSGETHSATSTQALPAEGCDEAFSSDSTEVAVDESCFASQSAPFDIEVEWVLDRFGPWWDYAEVLMTPVVGRLIDENGDGVLNASDTPNIALVSDYGWVDNMHGILRVLDGRGTTEHTSIQKVTSGDYDYFPFQYTNLALGDVNADGTPEIVFVAEFIGTTGHGNPGDPHDTGQEPVREAVDPNCGVVAIHPNGDLIWAQQEPPILCGGHSPAVADLQGDGSVEVVVGNLVLQGADGSVLAELEEGIGAHMAYHQIGYQSFPADLEGDGQLEIVTGKALFEADGSLRCVTQGNDGFPAVADLDGDGDGEIVVVGDNEAWILDEHCQVLSSFALSGWGNGGPPTLADMDGDGAVEIGIATAETYGVYEQDGSIAWQHNITDESSQAVSASVFDFDGNGVAEVLVAEETGFWVLDGATGQPLYTYADHTSRTLHEYPVIADVDGDGAAEIVLPNGGTHGGPGNTGLVVFGGTNWRSARPVWNQHAYSITNIGDDLTIPSPASPNWPTYNSFRSGSLVEANSAGAPDAVALIDGVCLERCDQGVVLVGVRLGNSGAGAVDDTVSMALYAQQADNSLVLLDSLTNPESLRTGEAGAVTVLEVQASALVNATLVLSADDDGAGNGTLSECNEQNNQAELEGPFCP